MPALGPGLRLVVYALGLGVGAAVLLAMLMATSRSVGYAVTRCARRTSMQDGMHPIATDRYQAELNQQK